MEVKQSKLANGLVVISDYFKSVESVSLQVAVNVGSRNETKAENGISHFIEHMAFKGTKKRTAKQIAEQFEEIGGFFNAYTSRDKTVFYCKCLKEDIGIAMDILSDIVLNSVFSDEEIERERQVILQELANCLDTPDDIVFDYFQELLYPEQPLGRSILGPKENISNFTKEEIKDYFYRYYNAENMVIAASGNLDHDTLLKLSEEYFSKLKGSKTAKVEAGKYVGGSKIVKKDLEQSQIIIGYQGITRIDPNFYNLQIYNNILGEGMSSKLFQKVREQNGLCYSIYSFASCYEDSGSFSIYTATDPKNSEKAIELINKTIQESLTEITEEDIQKSIKSYKANLLMSLENTIARARRVAYSYFNHGRFLSNEDILNELEQVSPKNINEVMAGILASKQSIINYGKN